MDSSHSPSALLDFTPTAEAFLGDVLAGLAKRPRHLPCKYFYDERGSRLFEEICGLQEYYLTRTELAIMRRHVGEMADQIGSGVMLVEYGSGSGMKTRILLDHLHAPVAYAPVDISREHLQWTADRLSLAYARLEVLPVCADFTEDFTLPVSEATPTHAAVYFPGSTIGNFHPEAACALLARIARICGSGGGLLIGIDLQKDPATLEAAYNDSKGVTAEFNLNLLRRINRELSGEFDLASFEHKAVYNPDHGRVELYLVSCRSQDIAIGSKSFRLEAGEPICTEYSYKYTIDGFAAMAADAGLTLRRSWTDENELFAVLHLAVAD
jgi:dimethylhistidine N-methyltransferase